MLLPLAQHVLLCPWILCLQLHEQARLEGLQAIQPVDAGLPQQQSSTTLQGCGGIVCKLQLKEASWVHQVLGKLPDDASIPDPCQLNPKASLQHCSLRKAGRLVSFRLHSLRHARIQDLYIHARRIHVQNLLLLLLLLFHIILKAADALPLCLEKPEEPSG